MTDFIQIVCILVITWIRIFDVVDPVLQFALQLGKVQFCLINFFRITKIACCQDHGLGICKQRTAGRNCHHNDHDQQTCHAHACHKRHMLLKHFLAFLHQIH